MTETRRPAGRAACLILVLLSAFLGIGASAAAEEPPITEFQVAPGSSAAGAHADAIVHLRLGTGLYPPVPPEFGFPEIDRPYALHQSKSLAVDLPPGFLADPTAVANCTDSDLLETRTCPDAAQVGIVNLHFGNAYAETEELDQLYPLFNLSRGPEQVARLGFPFDGGEAVVHFNVRLRDDSDFGATATVTNIPTAFSFYDAEVRLWGVPAAGSHDGERASCYVPVFEKFECAASVPGSQTFLVNPPLCEPAAASAEGVFYDLPGQTVRAPLFTFPGFTDCGALPFDPALTFAPDSGEADQPAAYRTELSVPQGADDDATGRATAFLRDLSVTLPVGTAISPSAATGLGACTEAELGVGSDAVESCPDNSRIGTVTVHSPLLERELTGVVYLGSQASNDPASGDMYRLFVVAAGTGIRVKLKGGVAADPRTGRLTARFAQNPRVPFDHLSLRLDGGPRAPLTTPPTCGSYTTAADLVPWSAPATASVASSSTFTIGSGPNGSACAPGEAQMPDGRAFEAGTEDPRAGSFSPFALTVSRADGSQRIATLNATLPPGLLARLAGVAYCPATQIAAAANRSGSEESAGPSCPAASEVGQVTIAAGPGSEPFVARGHVYLAGPYRGAPLSLAIVTPALAGPYDLGTVVVRAALDIDPRTAQVRVESDPIPTILAGIPLDLRSIAVSVDRKGFTLNPTSCEPSTVTASTVSPAGGTASLGSRFGATECGRLGFAPRLSLALTGQTRRGGHPSLRAKVGLGSGSAGIHRFAVRLPHSEFLAQNHIRTVCTRVQFAAGAGHGAGCPAGSVYGYAKAESPLLDAPLAGPVYLRSSDNTLPDLVAALGGQVDIELVGRIDSKGGGIRTTFENVPDAPVTSFTLRLAGGRRGLLENSTAICRAGARAYASAIGQNSRRFTQRPPLRATDCGRKKGPGR